MAELILTFDLARAQMISDNDRLHWAVEARRVTYLRRLSALQKRSRAGDLHMPLAQCVATWQAPTRRAFDSANWNPTVKALVDGVCTGPTKRRWPSALLPDDDNAHLVGPDPRFDPELTGTGKYRVTLTFTELAELPAVAPACPI